MRTLFHHLVAVWELLLIAVRGGYRRNSAYWAWRSETAFGQDPGRMPDARARRRQILDFARWVNHMKRFR